MAKLAIKKSKGEPAASATEELMKSFQKEYGEEVGSFGGAYANTDRIPTGLFALDLATGGGFPRGRCSIVYGPESSCKTNSAYLAIASHQKLWPDERCSFVDIERAFDKAYAKKFGVDVDKLAVLRPQFAEQAVDITEGLLSAADAGLCVVDSLAALVTAGEMDSSAEKAVVGGASNPVGKMVRKTTMAMGEAVKQGRYPSLIYINQIRHKIGVMFGDPENMPGGFAPRFQASLWLRFYGKNIIDNKINQDLPVRKEVKVQVKKWKVPIFSTGAQFEMATIAHKGLKVGQSDDFDLVKVLLEGMGEWEKVKGGYHILGQVYPTQSAFEQRLLSDFVFATTLKQALISDALGKAMMDDEGELPDDE